MAILLFLSATTLVTAKIDQQRSEEKRHSTTQNSVVGNWEGKLEDIPAVEIKFRLEGDRLAGTAVFYVVDPGAGAVVKGEKAEAELIEPRVEGMLVTFKIKRKDG
ncbi:MAG TPA: hypothetical protein VFV34_04690, partial [Blastocatellia bacterium]|nr:hypothetical protein [Blastocatellia bacterium]